VESRQQGSIVAGAMVHRASTTKTGLTTDVAAARSSILEVRALTVRYGSTVALDGVDLVVPDGQFVTLLGPSGCGKTTLLRAIAGLVEPSDGEIAIKGRSVNNVPIHRRNIGLVFQNYALFPHKTIFDNVAFGLKYRGIDRHTIAKKVDNALAAVRLPGYAERMPSQLSGGQQQRVALARALVIEPDLLLLDEPLSALDANLREQMRLELKQIQRRFGIASVFVTHDQEEALALSDKVVVMNNARVEQIGTPEDVYRRPASSFVAGFVGQSNILDGKLVGSSGAYVVAEIEGGLRLKAILDGAASPGTPIKVVIKAHSINVVADPSRARGSDGENRLAGVVEGVSYLGGFTLCVIGTQGLSLKAIITQPDFQPTERQEVALTIPPDQCRILPTGA
jgi:ABC-type Fe3+/spermidine/putrescine transport system ATPase subunit